jgi:hypothetical protein
VWYPFSYYNVRYGLELLPVFAVFPAVLAGFLAERIAIKSLRNAAWAAVVALVAASYVSVYAEAPITLREARNNSRDRVALEQGLASVLVQLPPTATLLMYEAEHPDVLRLAGIPLRHVISEAEHPDWEWALLDPHRADFIITCKGDPVWTAMRTHRADFTDMISITAPHQSSCTVYKPKQN